MSPLPLGMVASSGVQQGAIPEGNMIFYYDSGNTSSYPGSGTTWYDLSGNNINMTLSGSLTYSSAFGGILTSDAKGDRASVGHNPSVYGSNSFTMIAWVRGTHPGPSTHNMPDIGYGSLSWPRVGLFENTVYSDPNWKYLSYTSSGSSTRFEIPIGPSSTTDFAMVCVTVDRSANVSKGFFNGALTNTVSGVPSVSGSNATFGVYRSGYTYDPWNEAFIGEIPVVLFYSRALSEAEILGVFQFYKSRYGI